MELIDRIDGFGKVNLTGQEKKMLDELEDITFTAGINYVLGETNEPTRFYEKLMKDLFPMFPLIKGAGLGPNFQNSYSLRRVSIEESYFGFRELRTELRVGSRMSIGTETKNVELRFNIPHTAQQEEYFLCVVVRDYQLGCIDDMVQELGKRETPRIMGIEKITFYKDPVNKEDDIVYGIAEVQQLQLVSELYSKASSLLREAPVIIKVSVPELRVLREDMLNHPNIALRRLSAVEYSKVLKALTQQ